MSQHARKNGYNRGLKMKENKRRLGDRRDGTLLRDIDSMHYITPYLYPNRADNEAYISERIDLTAINEYLEKKNAGSDTKWTLFHVVLAAAMKTVRLRPKLNRFIQGKRLYQRNELTAAFVVKKTFSDESHEALAYLHFLPDDTIDTIHERLMKEINSTRGETLDNSTSAMDMMMRMPRFLCSFLMAIFRRMDYHGKMPASLVATDPYYATCMFSNLGSIKLRSGYHHLTNWGTNSLFIIIGEKKTVPVFNADGSFTMKETVDIGLTVDERIADGYYYSKSVALLKKLLSEPELLELPASQEV